jgi:predicted metal-dependent peptidase
MLTPDQIEAEKKILKARARLMMSQPFFAVLIMHMGVHPGPEGSGIDTMATDGKRLFYWAPFVLKLKMEELEAVLAHEVMHVCYLHHTRRGDRQGDIWNIAGDFVINADLRRAGIKLPNPHLYDQKYEGMSTEQVYNLLVKNAKKVKGGDGSDPGKCGGVMDAAPPYASSEMKEAERRAQVQVRQAMAVARAKNVGSIPAPLVKMMADLDKPTITWKELFRDWADESRIVDTDWTRPSRRDYGDGIILPGSGSIAPSHIVAWVDTSGSMDERSLAAIMAELQGFLDESACEKLTVGFCDCAVQETLEFEAGDIINVCPKPGGGTDFAPAFRWTAEHAPKASGVVYLTDLCCHSFGQEPGCPVLWVRYGGYSNKPPFGKLLDLDPSA